MRQSLEKEVKALRMFRTIVEDAPIMIIVLSPDMDCRLLYINVAVEKELCVLRSNILGRYAIKFAVLNFSGQE